MKKQYVIYCIINLKNGKKYIGQTYNFEQRKHDHLCLSKNCTVIDRAIKKYSKNSFNFKIIEQCPNQRVTNQREIYWIKKLNTKAHDDGYNIKDGGNGGGKCSEKTRRKMGILKKLWLKTHNHSRLGKHQSVESNCKNSESVKLWHKTHQNPMQDKHHSLKTKRKLSTLRKLWFKTHDHPRLGIHCSIETKRKIGEGNTGKIRSKEIKRKMGAAHTGKFYKPWGISKYKGVSKHTGNWQAQIGSEKGQRYLGYFKTEIEAAKAYDVKAKELYGNIAILNFSNV